MTFDAIVNRRRVLKGATGAALAGIGVSAYGGQAIADPGSCPNGCHECWLDIKPGSCPNPINPESRGVVPVLVGWPHLDSETVRLVPRSEDWGDCSDREIPEEPAPTCGQAKDIHSSGAGTEPIRAQRVDENGDGDDEWNFKFDTQELELDESVRSAVLVAEGTGKTSGCTVWGVDSVNIVGGNGRNRGGNANGQGSGTDGAGGGRDD